MRQTGQVLPAFGFRTLSGATWRSDAAAPTPFRLLVVYRGMWCGQCKKQLIALNELHDSFVSAGAPPIAVSADTEPRCRSTQRDYKLDKLDLGFEIPIDLARQLGVFVSTGVTEREMPLFCEPATFLITADNRIQAAWITSCAFGRVRMDEVRGYVDFVKEHPGRPPRGSG